MISPSPKRKEGNYAKSQEALAAYSLRFPKLISTYKLFCGDTFLWFQKAKWTTILEDLEGSQITAEFSQKVRVREKGLEAILSFILLKSFGPVFKIVNN